MQSVCCRTLCCGSRWLPSPFYKHQLCFESAPDSGNYKDCCEPVRLTHVRCVDEREFIVSINERIYSKPNSILCFFGQYPHPSIQRFFSCIQLYQCSHFSLSKKHFLITIPTGIHRYIFFLICIFNSCAGVVESCPCDVGHYAARQGDCPDLKIPIKLLWTPYTRCSPLLCFGMATDSALR